MLEAATGGHHGRDCCPSRVPARARSRTTSARAEKMRDGRTGRRERVTTRREGQALNQNRADPRRLRVFEQVGHRVAVDRLVLVMLIHSRCARFADDVRLAQERFPVRVIRVIVVDVDVVEVDSVASEIVKRAAGAARLAMP